MTLRRKALLAVAALAVTGVALAGCSSGNPFDEPSQEAGGSASIVVGSAAFPESEIIMQIYAQALEAEGVKVQTKPNIGQRDVYLAALKDGSIDLIPEYSGNLLQFFDKKATESSSEDVYAALQKAAKLHGYEVLDQAKAQDKDSYNVTKKFSQEHGVKSLADLAALGIPLKVGANPEFAERPYGIPGLKDVYGIDATLVPISDSSGPLTVKALAEGTVDLADIYTTTPAIKENDFVTLEDPKNLIIAQNVVPLITKSKVTDTVKRVLNKVSSLLTTEDLIDMNAKSSGAQKLSASAIAKDWLKSHELLK